MGRERNPTGEDGIAGQGSLFRRERQHQSKYRAWSLFFSRGLSLVDEKKSNTSHGSVPWAARVRDSVHRQGRDAPMKTTSRGHTLQLETWRESGVFFKLVCWTPRGTNTVCFFGCSSFSVLVSLRVSSVCPASFIHIACILSGRCLLVQVVRDGLDKVVGGDKQALSAVFSVNGCEPIGRLRLVLRTVQVEFYKEDARFVHLKNLALTIESVLKELGAFRQWRLGCEDDGANGAKTLHQVCLRCRRRLIECNAFWTSGDTWRSKTSDSETTEVSWYKAATTCYAISDTIRERQRKKSPSLTATTALLEGMPLSAYSGHTCGPIVGTSALETGLET